MMSEQQAALESGLYGKDFLRTWDFALDDLHAVLQAAEVLRQMHRAHLPTAVFPSGLAVTIFRDKSTRTRYSFAAAANLVGLALQELDEAKSQITHGETVRETASMISFLTEVIGIRDDMYLGQGHRYMLEVAEALDEGSREGVLARRPAVINLQCDEDHPTQALADLMHLQNTFGSLENLRGKKLAMAWAYSPSYGKPLSVSQGVISLMTRFGMDVVLAHPPGYELIPDIVERAAVQAQASGGSFRLVHSMAEAFDGADVVYPKSWGPYRIMEQRTRLLLEGTPAELDDLEAKCLAENALHEDWECSQELISKTRDGSALYMHCLPADITAVSCPAGEVSAEVFQQYRLQTYKQASYKPFIIAALILLARVRRPSEVLAARAGRHVET